MIARSEIIHERLWQRALVVARTPSSIMTGLFVQSLNELIDDHSKRVAVGLRGRLPGSIWLALFGLAVLGLSSLGYQAGLSATRRSPAMLVMTLDFAVVLYLIVDLDRSQEGLLQVSQQSMIDLLKSMKAVK